MFKILRRFQRASRGFTLIELLVGLLVFSLIISFIYMLYVRDERAQASGLDLAEAQQNARAALDEMTRELRSAGYGLDNSRHEAIEVASDYRVTFVLDLDGSGTIGPGERITYFLDENLQATAVSTTPNPRDRVVRRVASTAVDSMAQPVSGSGDIIAYGVTQKAGSNGVPTLPLFRYDNKSGTSLAGVATDPKNVFYGKTVPDSSLGLPAGAGRVSSIASILVQVTTEASRPSGPSKTYKSVTLSGRVVPRSAPYLPHGTGSVSDSIPSGGGGGGGEPPPGDTLPPADTLPPYVPPIRIPTQDVLSLALIETNERDSLEGSLTTLSNQRDLDIVVGTKNGTQNNMLVYWSGYPSGYTGNVLYKTAYSYSGISSYDLYGIGVGNTDGGDATYPDLVAGVRRGSNTGAIQSWRNQAAGGTRGVLGVGSFPGATTPNATLYQSTNPVTGEVHAVAMCDVDRNGTLDAVVGTRTGSNAGTCEIWYGNGAGSFTHNGSQDTYTASNAVYGVCLAYVDADTLPDLVAACAKNDNSGYVNVWLNNPSFHGHFVSKVTYDIGASAYAVAAADLDADGKQDIIVGTKSGSTTGQIQFWKNASGTFQKKDTATAKGPVTCLAIGPLDYGNDSPDVVAGNSQQSVQAWWVNPAGANGDILPAAESWSDKVTGGVVNAVAIGKLETSVTDPGGDVLNDIVAGVAISSTTGEIDVYLNPYVSTLP